MTEITLKQKAEDGDDLTAVFDVSRGMNLLSFKKGGLEVIDQSTKVLFKQRCAGLGAIVGPHFHQRKPVGTPIGPKGDLFDHFEFLRARGIKEPFSHGIARYVAWQAGASENTLIASLKGSYEHKGITLAQLEGQEFEMAFEAKLRPDGLVIRFSIESESPSLVGLHYYFGLSGLKSYVVSKVENTYRDKGVLKPIPIEWQSEAGLRFDLRNEADYGFRPAPDPYGGEIILVEDTHRLKIKYESRVPDNSWQLYHPKDASYVCIVPLSAQDPRSPKQRASRLIVELSIL